MLQIFKQSLLKKKQKQLLWCATSRCDNQKTSRDDKLKSVFETDLISYSFRREASFSFLYSSKYVTSSFECLNYCHIDQGWANLPVRGLDSEVDFDREPH